MMTYNQLALSTINSMNYLFLRYTFKEMDWDETDIVADELQNFVSNFVNFDYKSDVALKSILATELIESEYCADLTKQEARDLYTLALNKLVGSNDELIDFYISLLDDEYYASELIPKDYTHVTDRDNTVIHPGMVILFDLSVSQEPEFFVVKQIGHQLFIYRDKQQTFVNLYGIPKVFRATQATDNPDYIEGWGCPRCFSDDTTTMIASRENTCNRCGLEFPLPEEEARGNEDENTTYSLCQLTIDAQVKAYVDELDALEKAGVEPPANFTAFLSMSKDEGLIYDPKGNLKPGKEFF